MHKFSVLVSVTPIVSCPDAIIADVEVLGVVDVPVWPCLYAVDDLHDLSYETNSNFGGSATHPRFEVDQDGSRNIARIVALVVEDVLAVAAFCCEVLKITILADPMFLAQLLPKLATDC